MLRLLCICFIQIYRFLLLHLLISLVEHSSSLRLLHVHPPLPSDLRLSHCDCIYTFICTYRYAKRITLSAFVGYLGECLAVLPPSSALSLLSSALASCLALYSPVLSACILPCSVLSCSLCLHHACSLLSCPVIRTLSSSRGQSMLLFLSPVCLFV